MSKKRTNYTLETPTLSQKKLTQCDLGNTENSAFLPKNENNNTKFKKQLN
ncbi:hypothetical protein BPUTSESOX_1982 [uncultured Gammaproteobacteria bacterium]|jgi:hypothetical protein|nr:hypothetical protein [uncultured Gammaproteobacteria bacterium]VVH52288.1 hypothetical protein BPUTSESOX_1982 [uncultured Gammaproteobacteria bacterium]